MKQLSKTPSALTYLLFNYVDLGWPKGFSWKPFPWPFTLDEAKRQANVAQGPFRVVVSGYDKEKQRAWNEANPWSYRLPSLSDISKTIECIVTTYDGKNWIPFNRKFSPEEAKKYVESLRRECTYRVIVEGYNGQQQEAWTEENPWSVHVVKTGPREYFICVLNPQLAWSALDEKVSIEEAQEKVKTIKEPYRVFRFDVSLEDMLKWWEENKWALRSEKGVQGELV